MVDGLAGRGARWGQSVETAVEDGLDRPIGARVDVERAAAGRFDALSAEALHQAHDAQAGAEALFGMRALDENPLAQQGSASADGGRLAADPLNRPIGEAAM